LDIPLISDKTHALSKAYGVFMEEKGYTPRALFIIDTKGNVRQITINGLYRTNHANFDIVDRLTNYKLTTL
jgi:alkyl hydroperoxide reductase subunit AhpC